MRLCESRQVLCWYLFQVWYFTMCPMCAITGRIGVLDHEGLCSSNILTAKCSVFSHLLHTLCLLRLVTGLLYGCHLLLISDKTFTLLRDYAVLSWTIFVPHFAFSSCVLSYFVLIPSWWSSHKIDQCQWGKSFCTTFILTRGWVNSCLTSFRHIVTYLPAGTIQLSFEPDSHDTIAVSENSW